MNKHTYKQGQGKLCVPSKISWRENSKPYKKHRPNWRGRGREREGTGLTRFYKSISLAQASKQQEQDWNAEEIQQLKFKS